MDPIQAATSLESAADREQIFALLLRAARSKAPFVALLSVHADELRSRKALADDRFDLSRVQDLSVPRGAVPVFEEAIESRSPFVGSLSNGDAAVEDLLRALGGVVPPAAMLLPVVIGERTIALVVGHRGDEAMVPDDVAELLPLVETSGRVLARFLKQRAETAAQKPGKRAQTQSGEAGEDEITTLRRMLAVYRQYESWEELADGIRALLRAGMDRGIPDEDEQLELLVELGRVEAEHLGRGELAIEALRSAQAIDAGDPRVQESLEKALVGQGRWEEVVGLLETRASLSEDLQGRISLLLNAAELARERLGDEERAREAWETVLRWEPTQEIAAEKLGELYRLRGQWAPLAGLLVEMASRRDDPGARLDALESAARIYEEQVNDPRAAFLVWLTVLRREPERSAPMEALERLGPAADAWYELLPECAVLAEELEAEHPQVAARLWRQTGRWHRDQVGNRDSAAMALERALKLEPDDAEALAELADLGRAGGSWLDLAGALSRRAELELDPAKRAAIFTELAEVYETRLGQAAEAVACYEQAALADPSCVTALRALRRLHQTSGDAEALATVCTRLLEELPADAAAERIELHLERGGVLAERLGRSEEAAQAYREVIALDAKNLTAFHGLEEIHRAAGQIDTYLETLEAELDAVGPEAARRYAEVAAAWKERGRFDGAARCWQKLLAVVTGSERVPMLLELAAVLETGVDDLEGAAAACREVLTLAGPHPVALDTLARLHERAGRWNEALEPLERLYAETAGARERAALQQRIGAVHAQRGDTARALACYELALTLDAVHPQAHEGMAGLYRGQSDWSKATHHLLRAAQAYERPADVIRCLSQAAELYGERLGDGEKARAAWQRVLELDPDHAEAARGLRAILSGQGQWEALWPRLEAQVGRMREDASATPRQRLEVFGEAARCAAQLQRWGQALELFDLALAIEPGSAPLLMERAAALYGAQSWEEAAKAYQAIVAHHGSALEKPQAVEIWRRVALTQKQLGRIPQAIGFYNKALGLERQPDLQRELVELLIENDRIDDAIAGLRELGELVGPPERAAVFERMGDLQQQKLKNPNRAASAYHQAVELAPTNHRILQKLLDVQTDTEQWKPALETIVRFVELEKDPPKRARYHLASASIRRFKLRDDDGALLAYDQALDAFFEGGAVDEATRGRALEAFREMDEVYTAHKDWQHQERAYRAMIKRLPQGDPVLISLWHALGEIHRTRLKKYEHAVAAFETAHALDPEKNPDRVKMISELYALIGKAAPAKTTDRATKLVEGDPSNAETYRALGRACVEAGRMDEAWCVCRALVHLKQANATEEALYQQYRSQELRKAKGILDEDSWGLLRAEDEDKVVTAIFALIWDGPVMLRAGPPKSFQLKPKEKLTVEGQTGLMAKIFQNAARVLNAPLPHVYVQPHRTGRLLLASVIEDGRLSPAVIVGRDLMSGFRDTEIAFAVASMLALLRPAYYLRLALPALEELEAALAAAAGLSGRPFAARRPETAALIETFAVEIQRRLTPPAAERLRDLVKRLSDRPDLRRWRNAVDTAGRHAGLLVCGELGAAASMIAAEPAPADGPRPADKVRELVVWSVSSNYFAARRHLGITVT